jgi:predicted alpha-1,2-mannosidase
VPAIHGRSVSKTTEYAANDWALAAFAEALGETADAEALRARAVGYRELYDPDHGFLRGRHTTGNFLPGDNFDPLDFSEEYAEANAWHSVWMAMHDVDGLAALMGGTDAFIARLEVFFDEAAADLEARPFDDIGASSMPRPYYWHGNEPDIQAAYMFGAAGRLDLTSIWVRWIREHLYTDGPDGSAGNDDGGTLGAWYVWSALGLYPIAGTDAYYIGVPLFPRVDVRLPGGTFTVLADGLSSENVFVERLELDGVPVTEVRHADLRPGATLRFVMVATAP